MKLAGWQVALAFVAGVTIAHWGGEMAVAATARPVFAEPSAQDQAAIEHAVHEFGRMMGDLKGPRPSLLFDADEPAPLYLAEEMDDWAEGWDGLRAYHDDPKMLAFVDAVDLHPSRFRIKMLTPDLALVAWHIHAEQKMRGGKPWAEWLRANAILHRTPAGWRFVYYAEAARSTMRYVREMYERLASPEFRARFENKP